ncbi:hypothetical protein T439DRAFT_325268 [Meredithblackwellia eburnea MCA 4105]
MLTYADILDVKFDHYQPLPATNSKSKRKGKRPSSNMSPMDGLGSMLIRTARAKAQENGTALPRTAKKMSNLVYKLDQTIAHSPFGRKLQTKASKDLLARHTATGLAMNDWNEGHLRDEERVKLWLRETVVLPSMWVAQAVAPEAGKLQCYANSRDPKVDLAVGDTTMTTMYLHCELKGIPNMDKLRGLLAVEDGSVIRCQYESTYSLNSSGEVCAKMACYMARDEVQYAILTSYSNSVLFHLPFKSSTIYFSDDIEFDDPIPPRQFFFNAILAGLPLRHPLPSPAPSSGSTSELPEAVEDEGDDASGQRPCQSERRSRGRGKESGESGGSGGRGEGSSAQNAGDVGQGDQQEADREVVYDEGRWKDTHKINKILYIDLGFCPGRFVKMESPSLSTHTVPSLPITPPEGSPSLSSPTTPATLALSTKPATPPSISFPSGSNTLHLVDDFPPIYTTAEGLILKLAEFNAHKLEMLKHEASVYQTLYPVQGSLVPRVYGIFTRTDEVEEVNLHEVEEVNLQDGEILFLVMEDAGKSLKELMKTSDWTNIKEEVRRDVLHLATELAVKYGVLHEDLTPPNVTRRKGDGALMLIDWGLSSWARDADEAVIKKKLLRQLELRDENDMDSELEAL